MCCAPNRGPDAVASELQRDGAAGAVADGGDPAGVAFHHPPVDQPVLPGIGYHPRHAQRAWRDIVDLLAECLPVTG